MKKKREIFKGNWEKIPVHGYWDLPLEPKAMVVLIHGFGEHSGRYLNEVVPFFTSMDLGIFSFDLIGHGLTGGKRGHCQGYDQLLRFVDRGCRITRERFPSLPLIVFGHSMGGNLALNYVLRGMGRPEGLIASSPYLRLAFRPPAWKWYMGKLLYKIAPAVTFPSGLDPGGISRDPEEVMAYQNDPLIHDRVSPRYSFPVIEAGQWALEHAGDLSVPALLLHGTGDSIIDPEGSRLFGERSVQTQLSMIEGGYHELHHDLDRAAYFKTISRWITDLLLSVGSLEISHG